MRFQLKTMKKLLKNNCKYRKSQRREWIGSLGGFLSAKRGFVQLPVLAGFW
jgi:hypothetical protein